MSKTPEEIEVINKQRAIVFELLALAQRIMRDTGCSLGADTIRECAVTLRKDGCDEY